MVKAVLLLGGLALMLATPGILVFSFRQMLRDGARRSGGAASAGIAGSMLELERMLQPSTEHVREAEEPVVHEQEIGGE